MIQQSRSDTYTVRSIGNYLRRISQIGISPHALAFRGQKDKKWKLKSSAERRLKISSSEGATNEAFIAYHEELIGACKRNRFDRLAGEQLDELELLAHLQHHRAATCLIDFTQNALVALWFACEDTGVDGKVFVVNTDSEYFEQIDLNDRQRHSIREILEFQTRKDRGEQPDKLTSQQVSNSAEERPQFWRWIPANLNERILAQHSMFIFGPLSSGRPDTVEMVVHSDMKEQIREELRDVHHIDEEYLFPDFVGFAYTQRHDAIYGPSATGYFRLGREAMQKGDYSEAKHSFDSAIRINPKFGMAHRFRGRVHEGLDDLNSAVEDYSTAIELGWDRPIAYVVRGRAFGRLGEFNSAIQDYSTLIENSPEEPRGYELRAQVYERIDDTENAISDYSTIIEKHPDRHRTHSSRGLLYEELGNLEAAIQDYSTEISLDPDSPWIYQLRARAYEKQCKLEDAVRDHTEVITLMPTESSAYNLRGRVYEELRDFGNAVRDHSNAIALDPGCASLYGARAIAFLCQQQWEQAKSDFAVASNLELDIPTFFKESYGSVVAFEAKMSIQLPDDIRSMVVSKDPRSVD